MMRFLKEKIFHPFLVAAFPVVFLYAENANMVSASQVWPPLTIALLLTVIVFAFSWLLLRNWYKAGLITSIFVGLFFVYNPIFSIMKTLSVAGYTIDRHRELIIIFLSLLIVIGFYLSRTKNTFHSLTLVLNVTALILLLPSVLQLMKFGVLPYAKIINSNSGYVKTVNNNPPDIYYFVMDAYARQDVLKETYNYDNQPFLNSLKHRGFYVAEKSTSNYFKTVHSIPSSLNMDYLQSLIAAKDLKKPNTISAKKLVQKSRFRQILSANNFKYICFSSGVDFSEIEDADEYFSPRVDLSELDQALISISPIPDLLQTFFSVDFYAVQRATVLYPFVHIKEAIRIPEAKFVQLHILSPHPPFVFDQFGNSVEVRNHPDIYRNDDFYTNKLSPDFQEQYQEHKTAYIEQLKFINKKLLQTIDTILAHSAKPPVIIIQSDHGARLNCHINNIDASNHFESFANLSTFYFPDQDTTSLYQEISPVNIFRIITNKYFNGNLPLLPDRSYYSPENDPYHFTDVTKVVQQNKTGLIVPIQP